MARQLDTTGFWETPKVPPPEPIRDEEWAGLMDVFRAVGVVPHPGQELVLREPARVKILLCGRRWGKTYLNAMACFYHTLQMHKVDFPYARIRITGPQHAHIKETVNYLERMINYVGLPFKRVTNPKDPHWMLGKVRLETRPFARRGAQRGAGLTFLVIDEVSEVSEEMFYNELYPTVLDYQGHVLMAGTPKGLNWIVRFAESNGIEVPYSNLNGFRVLKSPDHQVMLMRSPSWENPVLDPEFVEAFRRTNTEEAFRQEIAAEILFNYGHPFPVLPIFASDAFDYRTHYQYLIGLDYGFQTPSAAVLLAKDERGYYHVIETRYQSGLSIAAFIEWAEQLTPPFNQPLYVADPDFFSQRGERTIAEKFAQAGIPLVRAPYHRIDRWRILRELLNERRLIVYREKNLDLIRELEGAEIKHNQPDDIKKPDHALSALGYALAVAETIRVEEPYELAPNVQSMIERKARAKMNPTMRKPAPYRMSKRNLFWR